jgi:hypothetical protein
LFVAVSSQRFDARSRVFLFISVAVLTLSVHRNRGQLGGDCIGLKIQTQEL